MEFLSGMVVGSLLTIACAFLFKFYSKSERKDDLLADLQHKSFEEKITLKDKV